MKMKPIATAFTLVVISTLSACGWAADTSAVPNDPVEVARAEFKARLDGGDWRIYLSKRWQDVITPAIMDAMNLHKESRRELPNALPEMATAGSTQLKDVSLVNNTGSTAIVEYHLSGGEDKATLRDYLIKEDDQWVVDTLCPIRPEWAMPADLRPIYKAILDIANQQYDAFSEEQGGWKIDPAAIEAFASRYFADISLAQVGTKQFAERFRAHAPQVLGKRRWMKPFIWDIEWVETYGQTQYAQAVVGHIVYWPNDKGKMEAVVAGSASLHYIKEHGQWKWLVDIKDKDLAYRFLQLWIDRDKATIERLVAADAKFDLGTGKIVTWTEMAKNLPALSKADPVTHARGRSFLSKLEFTEAGRKSGEYEVAIASVPVGPLVSWKAISSVRYLAPDMQTAQKLIADAQKKQAHSPILVKPVPVFHGKLVPPPANLPVELRRKGDRGGIYFDDILLKNDGRAVFFDDFQSGGLSLWPSADDARVECSGSDSKACCLYLNQRGPVVSDAFHVVSVQHPGVVELSAWVWLPPTSEQIPAFTSLNLYSSGNDTAGVGVQVDSKSRGYRIRLQWNRSDGDDKEIESKTVVLRPGKWARIALRLDAGTKKMSALLDGVPKVSFHYAPANFGKIDMLSVWGWLGARK